MKTKNISLDTSFFESQNFLHGSIVRELSKLGQDQEINLFITDICYREVLARFRKNIVAAEEKSKKPKRELESNARVLRNFTQYNSYFELPQIDIEALTKDFKTKFDDWLANSRTAVVDTSDVRAKEVFDDYFTDKPPFQKEQKKHEFPDAFSLRALNNFFQQKPTYFLTADDDFTATATFFPEKDFPAFIDSLIRSVSETRDLQKAIKVVEKEFQSSLAMLEEQTIILLKDSIEDELGSITEFDNIVVRGINYVEIYELTISPFSIIQLGKKKGELIASISFSFNASLEIINLENEWFDHGRNFWHPAHQEDILITDTYESDIVIEVTIDLAAERAEFNVTETNEGESFEVLETLRQAL